MKTKRIVLNGLFLATNIVSCAFFFGVASPVYVSESKFVIDNTAGNDRGGLSGLLKSGVYSLGGGYVVHDYISSWSGMADAQRHLDLPAMFSKGDAVTRFGGLLHPRKDDVGLYGYLGHQVTDGVDDTDSVSTLRVSAYTAQDALNLNRELLSNSRTVLNNLNASEVAEATALSKAEVDTTRRQLATDEKQLADLRNASGDFDPAVQNQTDIAMLSEVESKLLADKGKLAALQVSTPASPLIPGLKASILSSEEVLRERSSQVSGRSNSLASQNAAYSNLKAQETVDIEIVKQAELQYQAALSEAQKHRFALNVLSAPDASTAPRGPHRLLDAGVIFLVTLLLWSLLR